MVTGSAMAALAQRPMLDKAVKTPCTESRLCVWGHTGRRPESLHEPRKDVVRDVTPEARRHAFCPAWRTWDRHYGIGTHLRADGLLRPIKNMIALAFPGLQPLCGLSTGETALSGAQPNNPMGQNPPGPQPYLFHCIWENKTGKGPRGGE